MGHGEDQSIRQYLHDAHAADHDARRWLDGPRITQDDLRHGTGAIERVTSAQWFALQGGASASGTGNRAGAGGRVAGSGGHAGRGPLVFNWGNRHKGELAVDVRENDPGYWQWSLTLNWWRAKVKAAGLLDDEEEAA